MRQAPTNQPYVKKYNEQGDVTNPITTAYVHSNESNRASRKGRTARFHGNGKQHPLTVYDKGKYRRAVQIVPAKNLSQNAELVYIKSRRIEHYILVN